MSRTHIRPVFFPFFPSVRRQCVVVFTDASFSEMSGRLGVVVYCPCSAQWLYASAQVPSWMVALFSRLQRKSTYIGQFEILAAVCAYLTFPDLIEGQLVHHFLDNTSALNGLIKGSSTRPDSARLIHEYCVAVLRLACRPWLGFVYSEDNMADLPSRKEFAMLRRLRAARRRLVFPTLAAWLRPSGFFGTVL